MFYVFCRADDLPALWAYRGLKQRGLAPLEIFTPEALVYNRRLEHRLQGDRAVTHLELVDGRVLDGDRVRGVINRLDYLPVEQFRSASPEDQTYAAMEQQAIYLSWLSSLPGVMINPPGPRGLCGDVRSPAEWAWLATHAGLPVLPFHQDEHRSGDDYPVEGEPGISAEHWVVFDGEVYGDVDSSLIDTLRNAIRRLAIACGLRLFGLTFSRTRTGDLRFRSASVLPDLNLGGEALLDALMAALA